MPQNKLMACNSILNYSIRRFKLRKYLKFHLTLKINKYRISVLIISILLQLTISPFLVTTNLESKQVYATRSVLFDPPSKQTLKESNNPTVQDSLKQLFAIADSLLTKKPTSVTYKAQLPPSGDKHDFLSLAPYCWPDATKPDGLPYVCRDGMLNPERYSIPDRQNMRDMISDVKTLCLAYYISGNLLYASKAAELLRVWFLDNDTSMNPNLQFAETVKGLSNGTAHGIIAGRYLPDIIDSVALIHNSSAWTEKDKQGIKFWFREYLKWLLNSDAGKKESQSANNHGTWYDVQVSSIALFLNKKHLAKSILKTNMNQLVAIKIKPDGRQPLELVRRTSLGYSIFNLLGLFKLAILGQHIGVDLWNYRTHNGAGLQKALDFLLPYILKNKAWPYEQIHPLDPEDKMNMIELLCLGSVHYQGNESYIQAFRSINRSDMVLDINNLIYMCENNAK
jgi:alginate lyase